MTDLVLKRQLNLGGSLKLAAPGGKVKVSGAEVLVEVDRTTGVVHGTGIPVMLPPPPAPKPIDDGPKVRIYKSFNSSVTVKVQGKDVPVIALGICIQGNVPNGTWPGMVLPSTVNDTVNARVTVNDVPINVVGDTAITLPNGGTVPFTASGQ